MYKMHSPDPYCPTLAELREFAERCRRCRALVRRMEGNEPVAEAVETPAFKASRPARRTLADEAFGDVVIATTPDAPETLLVCVVVDPRRESAPGTLEVAPVSTDIAMASDFDVVLELADPLGYPALVEVWNHGTLIATQVSERLGRLTDTASSAVDALYRALLGDETAEVTEVSRGVSIESDEDPRAVFQEAEVERVRSFWSPAARLYSERADVGETVGSLLSDWLNETGSDVPGYAAQLGWPEHELALLYHDAFDPQEFSPERVGTALASAVGTPDDFEAALRLTISVEQFGRRAGPTRPHGMVFARAARRSKSARAPGARSASGTGPRDAGAELETYVTRAVRAFRRASGR
jgi:hypothetical protein